MDCNIGIFLTVILFSTFSLAEDASAEPCPGCRNNNCLVGTRMCADICIEGYFRKKANYSTCQKCPSTCKSCTSSTNCNDCIVGRWGDKCNKACPTDCKYCTSSTHCTQCREGYHGYECRQKCPTNCTACESSMHCTKCRDGFWGDTCQQRCSNSCTCDFVSGGCNSCKTGYVIKIGTNNEVICIPCKITNCNQCINKDLCKECEIGWYGNLCNHKCSDDCLNRNCTINGECVCKNGYFKTFKLDKSYTCHECPKGCAKCKSNSNCSGCKTGYWGHDCSKNCSRSCHGLSCYQSNGWCKNGCRKGLLTLENRTCIDCSRACANCTSGPACTECGEGGVCGKWGNTDEIQWLIFVLIGLAVLAMFLIFFIAILMARPFLCSKRTPNAVEGKLFRKRKSKEFKSGIRGSANKQAGRDRVTSVGEVSTCPTPPLPSRTVALEDLDDGGPSSVAIPIEDDERLYYNTTALHRNQIPILELQQKVAAMSKADFLNEFMRLPRGLVRPYRDALKPENEHKNRYLDIYPFDATRVRLKDGPGDYVNASHVEGHSNPNAYIAALGPTQANSEGYSLFWRMVWQEKVEVIVMLTNLMEGPTMKCEKYWPSVQSCVHYGDVTVEGLTESKYDEYVVREFTVSKGDERRKVTQMHFIVWPDKNVPDEERSLVDFRDEVNKIPRDYQQPIVIHCSAGIGRTGTYIALDILMEQGAAQQSVDIFGCVAALRGQRVNLVQNEVQYEYIHHALVYGFGRDVMYANVDIYQNVDVSQQGLVQPLDPQNDETVEIVSTEL